MATVCFVFQRLRYARLNVTRLLAVLYGSYWLLGCTSAKELVYFQKDSFATGPQAIAEQTPLTIRTGDVLSIQVSSLNQEASDFFNPYANSATTDKVAYQFTGTNPLPPAVGYLVDPEGTIEMPLVGKIEIKGLTVTQAATVIRDRLKKYLREPTVSIRNQSFRISVLGEVTRPSLFTIPDDHITLLEALSLAGDITIYGRRDNVLLIREVNGQRNFVRIDMTRRDLFRSPYFYLRPNDTIYVEPGKARITSADRLYLLIPALASTLSLIAIIIRR